MKDILDQIYKVKEVGYDIEKLIIPFRIQKDIALSLAPKLDDKWINAETLELIQENGLIELYGYPVEDGNKFQIVRKEHVLRTENNND